MILLATGDLRINLQRAAVISASFPPDVKRTLRDLANKVLHPNFPETLTDILECLENDPQDGTSKHPTLDMYDTDVICCALEMAVAAPFDTSGGGDMYESASRCRILNDMPGSELRERTKAVLSYFGTYSNALTESGPPTPATISSGIGGIPGGINAKLTAVVCRIGPECQYDPECERCPLQRWPSLCVKTYIFCTAHEL